MFGHSSKHRKNLIRAIHLRLFLLGVACCELRDELLVCEPHRTDYRETSGMGAGRDST